MLGEMLENVRAKRPLIHSITNYVTANDCANVLLACGASPVMADDENEVEDVTSICSGLCINLGTLDHRKVTAMLKAGKRAGELGHPVILDPVGAGSSRFRTETARKLLGEIGCSVVRGNVSEIRTLALGAGTTKGVDADRADRVTSENLERLSEVVKQFAAAAKTVAVATGAVDLVSDGDRVCRIYNGHSMMSSVTGTGCQLSVLTAAYVAANPEHRLEAAAAAVCAMGLCGEKAYERMEASDGNASYRNYLIDAVYRLTGEELESGARYEIR